jgi:hypothetical protein
MRGALFAVRAVNIGRLETLGEPAIVRITGGACLYSAALIHPLVVYVRFLCNELHGLSRRVL